MIAGVLSDVVPYLRCPVCHGGLTRRDAALGCEQGHRFDVARQGYVTLLPGSGRTGQADSAAMVAARAEFLASGEYALLSAAVTAAARTAVGDIGAGGRSATPGCLVDAGGGIGTYLADMLERSPERVGVCCDASAYAARRATRAHPRAGAVVADVWQGLPIRDGSAAAVLNVFAPRNAEEFHRVLHPDGALVVATPRPDHLREVVQRLGLLSVDEDKPRRLHESLDPRFERTAGRDVSWTMRLSRPGVQALVTMGPSAWHGAALDERLGVLPEPMEVTGSVTVSTYRPRRP